jgi:hypothetical protein
VSVVSNTVYSAATHRECALTQTQYYCDSFAGTRNGSLRSTTPRSVKFTQRTHTVHTTAYALPLDATCYTTLHPTYQHRRDSRTCLARSAFRCCTLSLIACMRAAFSASLSGGFGSVSDYCQ